MKKIVSAIALCAAASTFAADAVYSANIVGFTKVGLSDTGFTCLGVNFVGESGDGMTLTEIFGDQLISSPSPAMCDVIYLWDANSQEYIQLGYKSDGKFYNLSAWGGEAYEADVTTGTAMWLKPAMSAPAGREITLSGNVSLEPSETTTIVGGAAMPFNFIANAYPVEKSLSDILDISQLTASPSPALCDQVYLWDLESQEYVQVGLKTDGNWYALNNWGGSAVDTTIAPGEGLWLRSHNDIDMEIIKPF